MVGFARPALHEDADRTSDQDEGYQSSLTAASSTTGWWTLVITVQIDCACTSSAADRPVGKRLGAHRARQPGFINVYEGTGV
jgi:hypothetical protein